MANSQPTERHEEIQFRQLLNEAVTKPGVLMRAYSLFWNYSLGNQLLGHEGAGKVVAEEEVGHLDRAARSLPELRRWNSFSQIERV